MMLSEVQFKELLNLVRSQQTTTATGTGGPPGLGMHRRRIDVKNVKVDKFTGMVEEWDDFAFSFKELVVHKTWKPIELWWRWSSRTKTS